MELELLRNAMNLVVGTGKFGLQQKNYTENELSQDRVRLRLYVICIILDVCQKSTRKLSLLVYGLYCTETGDGLEILL